MTMYDKDYYDRREDPNLQKLLAHNLYKLLNSSTVLDIGCGRGWLVKATK